MLAFWSRSLIPCLRGLECTIFSFSTLKFLFAFIILLTRERKNVVMFQRKLKTPRISSSSGEKNPMEDSVVEKIRALEMKLEELLESESLVISLWNVVVFKLVTKTIANRLKLILFVFLVKVVEFIVIGQCPNPNN